MNLWYEWWVLIRARLSYNVKILVWQFSLLWTLYHNQPFCNASWWRRNNSLENFDILFHLIFYSISFNYFHYSLQPHSAVMSISFCADFTPSRGTTPVHHNFGTPSQNRIPGSMAKPSPDKKKKLLELFRESVKDDQDDVHGHNKQVKPTIQDVMPKSAHSTPYLSGANSACSSERTMSEDRVSIREKSVKSLQWCIPSLSSCRSFRERRSKTSPAIEVNGKHWFLL